MAKKTVFVEVPAGQYDVDAVMDKALKDYKKDNKTAVKNINLYIKPEDRKAYYTVNDDQYSGSVDL